MKFFIGLMMLSLLSFSVTHAQTLGNDDQTQASEENELNATSFPILKVVPYQWVELTDPTKEANVFNPTIRSRFSPATDEGAEPINLDFDFDYFGEKYNRAFVTVNGFLAFGSQGGGTGFVPGSNNSGSNRPTSVVTTPSDLIGPNSYGPGKIPSARPPNGVVAPFWADLDFGSDGAGYLYHRTFKPDKLDKSFDHFICEWDTAGFYFGDSHVTFELVLFPAGGIMFQYKEFLLSSFLQSELEFLQETGAESEDGVKFSELSEFEMLKEFFGITIGYEDAAGTRGTAWNFAIAAGTSLGNELIPDWVSGTNSDNFLDRIDGRDRRNNAVTGGAGGGGGCFVAKRHTREDR